MLHMNITYFCDQERISYSIKRLNLWNIKLQGSNYDLRLKKRTEGSQAFWTGVPTFRTDYHRW